MSEAIAPVAAPAASTSTPPPAANTQAAAAPEADIDTSADADGSDAEEGDSEPASKQSKAEAKREANLRKKFNLKVDGRDEEVEIDLSNEEEIRKHLQLSKAAYKRMQESAEMKKGVQELLDTLRNDPLKVLTDPRLQIPEETRKKLAEAIINDELQEMSKTPEQKEKERLQKEYERLKKEVEDERKARETAEFQRLQEQQAVQLDQDISKAIENSGLPKTARTVRYFAEALMFCLNNNLDLSAQDLIPYIKKQTLSEFKEMVSSLPDEEFESWLGKDQISRIRKRSMQRAKAVAEVNSIKQTAAEAPKETKAEKVNMRDFFKGLGK